jgi:anthranilate phosphoribosyltransferase
MTMLDKIVNRQDLTHDEAMRLMEELMEGSTSPGRAGALITALRMKGETAGEIAAFAEAMRKRCAAVPIPRNDGSPLLDTCGTGGDGWGTFNISTTVAFIAAAAGVKVVKHGNRAASSRCGSADVLEELGIAISLPREALAACLEETNFCFLFAREHHRAMGALAPLRSELGIRTIFNLLGPLTNPAGATHQVVGLFSPLYLDKVAEVLGVLGLSRAIVVHGDGTDEFTTTGPSYYRELRHGVITSHVAHAVDFGLPPARQEDLAGGDGPCNAAIIKEVLSGEKGPRRDIVLLNAGAALYIAEKAADFAGGIAIAASLLDSGRALGKLEEIAAWTRKYML